MSNHTFTPGDTVVHDATGEHGTLTSTNGVSAVVEWDTTGGKNPADILPVTDLVPASAWGDIESGEAPAGFHPDTTGTTSLVGPGYATDSWRVLTQWTPDAGVTYCIDSDHGVWTAAEVAELPKALEAIRREIDLAAALEYLRTRPELASKKVTVSALCQAAEAQGIGWGAMAEAWGIVTAGAQL